MTSNNVWTGQRLRDARGRMKHPDGRPWTQDDARQAIGTSLRSYSAWERGDATPQAHWNAKMDEVFADTEPAPTTEDRTNPRIKDATLQQLTYEVMIRVAQLEGKR